MTRIVYGISGEGSGHSSRAREMMTCLREAGHEVRAVSYDRGYRNLKDDFDVFETKGLHIRSVDNKVSVVRTFTENFAGLPDGMRRFRDLERELFKGFDPHCVITDFEPMTAYLALRHDLPLITLDNQHRMRYMRYPCPPELERDAKLTEAVIRAMVPKPDVSLVTTFYYGDLKNERTYLFPPILRREVLDQRSVTGDPVLVYFTSGFETFLSHLEECPRERFVVYGYDREEQVGNVEFKRASRAGFLADLASSKAVVSTAGFTLLTEAIHLGKPFLALPMKGQFEQELNALLLEETGFGKNGRESTADTLGDFLYRLPEYQAALARYEPQGNKAIQSKLLELVAEDGAEARACYERRRTR